MNLQTHPGLFLPPRSYPICVLLVDDQAIIAEAIRRMLKDQSDIIFHYCADPSKAIEIAAQVKPTVILQDLVMPGWEGLLLVKYFRSNPATRDVPIVVLSTQEEPKIKAEAFSLGANDYIVKLPDRLELVARIRYHSKAYIRLLERNEVYTKLEESQKVLLSELAEAATYVRSLLPAPLHDGIRTDWRFIPSMHLGGDAFGYHWIDESHFAMYILDVCGHGVGAALLAISVTHLLAAENLPKADFHDPSSVLKELNEIFQMEKHNQMFFTIWYGVYNKTTHEMIYSTGGHPPAVLVDNRQSLDVQIQELRTPGVVVGAIPVAEFRNASCKIIKDNRLYIFSDGIYEIYKDKGGMLELEEFIQFLAQSHFNENQELDEIVHYIQKIQGKTVFADDVSILRIIFD